MSDWRKVLIYTHRWLGIAGCLIFLMWFVSGVVMMYARMPRLTAEERLARLPPLDPALITTPLADVVRTSGHVPDRVRVGMLGDRPVFKLLSDGLWTTVFADTGLPLAGLTAAEAIRVVKHFVPEHAATVRYDQHLTRPDQWTIDGGLPNFLPLHRIGLGDAGGTYVYVSDRTGEPVMKTTARGRFWGFTGAVLHWTYFTPFRLQRELWRYSIIYVALLGAVMCLSGLVIGVWRYSLSRRYRLKRIPSHSPYSGFMWWHHYAGLLFGLTSFTWALSGALSLTPWDWVPSTEPSNAEAAVLTGGALRLETITIDRLRAATAAIRQSFEVKELEILQFQGRPFGMAYRPPAWTESAGWTNPDVAAMHSAQLAIDHRLVWLDAPHHASFTRFDDGAVVAAAHAVMPAVPVAAITWLSAYDAYYYDRWNSKPLPVLRVERDDPERTWYYLDPLHGSVALRHTRRTRLNRWLYNGLHSFDFPGLYASRPAWDLLLIILSAGGIALSVTTIAPGWHRLRRSVRRWRTG